MMTEPETPSLPANFQLPDDDSHMQGLVENLQDNQQRLKNRNLQLNATPMALQSIPAVGRFMPLAELSYDAHLQLIGDASLGLGFSPQSFSCFDALLPNTSAAHQPHMAVLRNYLMSIYFAQGQSQEHANALQSIAKTIGKSPFTDASGHGVQQLYARLLRRQNTPLLLMPSMWFARVKPSRWQLPALPLTPFSDEALARPAAAPSNTLQAVDAVSLADMVDRDQMSLQDTQKNIDEPTQAQELNEIANDMASAGALTMSVEELHEPTKRESIELAKDILNKLRVKMGEAFVSHGLELLGAEKLSVLGALKEVVKAFEFHLHKVAGLDPNIYDNPAVDRANQAVGKLSYLAKQETLKAAQATSDQQMAELIAKELGQFPSNWIPSAADQFTGLFDDLQSGLEAVLDRMTQIGDKDASAEFWLGFSTEKSVGNNQPSTSNTGKQEKGMADDQYYRQLNAQRAMRARQAAVRHNQRMQRERHNEKDHDTHPQPKSPSMSSVLSDDMMNAMRKSMKTTAGAGEVQTGTKANIQSVIKQKDQSVKAQRQRVTIEQVNRTNQRNQTDKQPEPTPPPGPKKKDHGHGL